MRIVHTSTRIRVLFLANTPSAGPWAADVTAALSADEFDLVTFDLSRSAEDQFDGVRVVVDLGGHGTREMIDAAARSGVGLWQAMTAGLDHTEVDYILEQGIRLTNTPGQYSAVALAEHALLLMLGVARQLPVAVANVSRGAINEPFGDELDGRTVGLVGFGWSGRELARRASALGMPVRAVDAIAPEPATLEELGVDRLDPPTALHDLLRDSDYVSIHVPLLETTRHLIGPAEFNVMKPTAVLINVARGGIVDEGALLEALVSGRIRGAGLDVFGQEPPDPSHPLLQLPNVLATPHIAGVTAGTSRRRAAVCAENARRFAAGQPLLHEVRAR